MTQPMWAADIAIDRALAALLIAVQFPALRSETLEAFGVGWDNAAFLVGGKLLFRFPRRRVAVPLMEREIAILPHVASHVPNAISAPTLLGTASDAYPYAFAGYDLIAGKTACSVALTDGGRCALAAPLGRFFRALHDIDPDPLVARGLPPDEIGRLDPEKRLRLARERAPLVSAHGIGGMARWIAWLEAHPPGPLPARERRVVHGDAYARHLVLDPDGGLAGVIDWGDMHVGDPALDLAIAHLVLPAHAHDGFRAAYGPIDDRTWNAARYRAIYHAILELDYGLREIDIGMRSSGSDALNLMDA